MGESNWAARGGELEGDEGKEKVWEEGRRKKSTSRGGFDFESRAGQDQDRPLQRAAPYHDGGSVQDSSDIDYWCYCYQLLHKVNY